jgi:hypothetical protein
MLNRRMLALCTIVPGSSKHFVGFQPPASQQYGAPAAAVQFCWWRQAASHCIGGINGMHCMLWKSSQA